MEVILCYLFITRAAIANIMLLDIWMPRLSGVDAIPEIRRVAPKTRLIMLTQHESGAYVEFSLRQGATGYVVKTSAMSHLIEALRAAGAEAVILGCTEITLAVDEGSSALPVYDTTALHAAAALDRALQ